MNFSIAKNTITRNEHIKGQLQYAGLPVSTDIIFTNNSPEVIILSVPKAETAMNKTTYRVTSTSGTIPVEIIGKGQGGFSVSADPGFH